MSKKAKQRKQDAADEERDRRQEMLALLASYERVDERAFAAYDHEYGMLNYGRPDESFRPGGPAAFADGEYPFVRWGPPMRLEDGHINACGKCTGIDFNTWPYTLQSQRSVATPWHESGPMESLCQAHAWEHEARNLDGRHPKTYRRA
jgi:hypothetical protein